MKPGTPEKKEHFLDTLAKEMGYDSLYKMAIAANVNDTTLSAYKTDYRRFTIISKTAVALRDIFLIEWEHDNGIITGFHRKPKETENEPTKTEN